MVVKRFGPYDPGSPAGPSGPPGSCSGAGGIVPETSWSYYAQPICCTLSSRSAGTLKSALAAWKVAAAANGVVAQVEAH